MNTIKRAVMIAAVMLMITVVCIGCSKKSDDPALPSISGTITLPGDATGKCYKAVLNTDINSADTTYVSSSGTVTGAAIAYSINNVSNGTYFLMAFVDVNGNASSANCADVTGAGVGDYIGFYGGTGTAPPTAANITIASASATYDFSIHTVMNTAQNSFNAVATTGAPTARANHSAVWTESEMIIWGGANGISSTGQTVFTATGGRYNPTTDAWTPTSTTGAPEGRMVHTAVWTGSKMIIWGGGTDSAAMTTTNTGGLYDPATDSWTAISTSGAPAARMSHVAVMAGLKMIVWGGDDGSATFGESNQRYNTGGVYDPATDTWTAVTTTNAPSGRNETAAIWTGTEMIVWGGDDGTGNVNTGGKYNPASNMWTTISTTDAPAARNEHTLVWTGSLMIAWGGHSWESGPGDIDVNTGAIYNPTTDVWEQATTLTDAPAVRNEHVAFWTGSKMLVWGGEDRITDASLNTGGLYDPGTDPGTDTWTATTTVNAPAAHHEFSAVWTGTEMIVWGGVNSDTNLTDPPIVYNDGGRYRP